MKTQVQMYYAAERRSAELNNQFLEAVKDGLTGDELKKLIAKRPNVYGRFKNWIEKLEG